ncbi:MAG: glycosyltransferase [Thermoanaerobaculia bacterium]
METAPPAVPALSVVIAAVNELDLLRHCVRALLSQPRSREIEIIVVDRVAEPGASAALAREFPGTVVVPGPGLTIPQMRARGFRAARAPIIAVLEDHTNVVPTWLEAMLRGHESPAAVVGGSVTNGCFSAVDWAAFFTEYNEHMTPMPQGPVPSLPGNNSSYKRSAVEALGDLFYRGLWETFLHAALAEKGFEFRCERGAEVIHAKPFSFAHFTHQRWHLARSYAGMRARSFSLARRLLFVAGSPLLLPLLTVRVLRRVASRRGHGYGRGLARSLPLLLFFLGVWTAAEFVGYLVGEGDSTLKIV